VSLYAVFETTLVGVAVAGGALSALRTFAPSAFKRVFELTKAETASSNEPSDGCSACSTCGGCGLRESGDLRSERPTGT
jgi:hypothetical protein